jgi:hypothetical protein
MKKILKISAWCLVFLVTLIVLFYVEENWRGAREWKKVSAELKAKGYPLTIAEIIPPPIPDEDNIAAAPIFAELFDAKGKDNPESRLKKAKLIYSSKKGALPVMTKGELGNLRLFIDKPDETPTVKQAAQNLLAQLDNEWNPLLAEVNQALQRSQCRWPLAYEKGFGTPLPNISASLNLTKSFTLRASIYLELAQSEKAANDLICVYRLAWATMQNPTMISILVSITEQQLATSVFWEGCIKNQWQEKDLARIQSALALLDNFSALKQSLPTERAILYATVPQLEKELRNYNDLLRLKNAWGLEKHQTFQLWLRPQGWSHLDLVRYAILTEAFQNSIDTQSAIINCERINILDKKIESLPENKIRYAFTLLAMPAIKKTTFGIALAGTTNHQAILACALERYKIHHGKLPLTLDELMPEYLDKVPNQVVISEPMIYRRVNDQDYLLYSIGWNMQDDGGVISDDNRADKLDWVWASKPELYQRRKIQPSPSTTD